MNRLLISVLLLASPLCFAQSLTENIQLLDKQKFQRAPFVDLFEFDSQVQQLLQGKSLPKQSKWLSIKQGDWMQLSHKDANSLWSEFWFTSKPKQNCLIQVPAPHINQDLVKLSDVLAADCSALAIARLHSHSLDFTRARYLPQSHMQTYFNYFAKAWHQTFPEGKSIQLFQIQPPTFGIRKETEESVWNKTDIFLSHGLPMQFESLNKIKACLNKSGFKRVTAFEPGMHLIDETQITQRNWVKAPEQFLRVGFTQEILATLVQDTKQQHKFVSCLVA